MRPGLSRLFRFLVAEDGPTAVEYAVMLALILMGIILVVAGVGSSTQRWWQHNTDTIVDAIRS